MPATTGFQKMVTSMQWSCWYQFNDDTKSLSCAISMFILEAMETHGRRETCSLEPKAGTTARPQTGKNSSNHEVYVWCMYVCIGICICICICICVYVNEYIYIYLLVQFPGGKKQHWTRQKCSHSAPDFPCGSVELGRWWTLAALQLQMIIADGWAGI